MVSTSAADRYYFDGWKAYAMLNGWAITRWAWVSRTRTRWNDGSHELRHYLVWLQGKTECYSRSLDGLSQEVKLFAWGWNRRQWWHHAEPKLKGKLRLLY